MKMKITVNLTHPLVLIALLFITLKLLGVITWSWWLVLIPVWVIAGCFVLLLMIIVFMAAVSFWAQL